MSDKEMTPGELAAKEQAEHEARMRIIEVGTVEYKFPRWRAEGWLFETTPAHPLAHGREGFINDAPTETAKNDERTVSGWTRRDLKEISSLEKDYQEEAGS